MLTQYCYGLWRLLMVLQWARCTLQRLQYQLKMGLWSRPERQVHSLVSITQQFILHEWQIYFFKHLLTPAPVIVSGAIGEVTIPTVVGFLITGLSHSAFLISILIMHLILIALYFVMVYYLIPLSKRNSKSYSTLNDKQKTEPMELGVITTTDDDIRLSASAELWSQLG